MSKVNKILKLIFVNRTQGITSSSDVLKIYFEEKKIIKIDKEKEKVYATIYFKKNMKEETAVFVSKLNKEIKKFGRVDEYDEIIFNNQMTISFNIELDKVNQFRETFFKVINKKLSMISKISIA